MICTWLWGDKYGLDDVAKIAAGVRRHLKQPYRFACIHDKGFPAFSDDVHHSWPIPDENLTKVPGCFARLRMFDPTWQKYYPSMWSGDDRLVCIDLDAITTGPLDPLFDLPDSFLILQGANAVNPCPYNGSIFMLRAGAHSEVWSDFSLEAARQVPFHEFPDDQGWLAHKIPNAAGWLAGAGSGIYAFQKRGWPQGDALPADARVVAFPGWRSPEKFKHLPWVKEHWHA